MNFSKSRRNLIDLGRGQTIPILYEDAAILAVDKPAGWLLAPENWRETRRNLQRALRLSLQAGDYWARSRNLRYIRFIHRLDADTSGVLLFAKSSGALQRFSQLFAQRLVDKVYLAVVEGVPTQTEWRCALKLSDEDQGIPKVRVDENNGQPAQTSFRTLAAMEGRALVEARPMTGRTHQIRVHLAAGGHPILHDPLYSTGASGTQGELALRAVGLAYQDPFRRRQVFIQAPCMLFCERHGFAGVDWRPWKKVEKVESSGS